MTCRQGTGSPRKPCGCSRDAQSMPARPPLHACVRPPGITQPPCTSNIPGPKPAPQRRKQASSQGGAGRRSLPRPPGPHTQQKPVDGALQAQGTSSLGACPNKSLPTPGSLSQAREVLLVSPAHGHAPQADILPSRPPAGMPSADSSLGSPHLGGNGHLLQHSGRPKVQMGVRSARARVSWFPRGVPL